MICLMESITSRLFDQPLGSSMGKWCLPPQKSPGKGPEACALLRLNSFSRPAQERQANWLLLYAFASLAAPFLARQGIWRIAVGTPVALDFVAASAVGISTLASNGADFAAGLTVFHGLGASGFGVLDGFGELFGHTSDRRFLILYWVCSDLSAIPCSKFCVPSVAFGMAFLMSSQRSFSPLKMVR